MKRLCVVAAAIATVIASPVSAEIVDFEDVPVGYIANPYTTGNVTFSSSGSLYVGSYGTNQLCSTGGTFCDQDLDLLFASSVSNLSFFISGLDSLSSMLSVELVTTGGGETVDFTNFSGFNDQLIDLGGRSNIVSARISTNDIWGISFDNISFTTGGAVPEPSTWAMMLIGFGFVGGAMRARRRQKLTVSYA